MRAERTPSASSIVKARPCAVWASADAAEKATSAGARSGKRIMSENRPMEVGRVCARGSGLERREGGSVTPRLDSIVNDVGRQITLSRSPQGLPEKSAEH